MTYRFSESQYDLCALRIPIGRMLVCSLALDRAEEIMALRDLTHLNAVLQAVEGYDGLCQGRSVAK